MTEQKVSFKIPLVNWKWFEKKMAKLQKAAKKCKAEDISFSVLGQEERIINKDKPDERIIKYNVVSVDGIRPKIKDSEFIGKIDHLGSGNIISTIPGFEGDLTKFRYRDRFCDHCQMIRNRNNTYIVKKDNGEILQVGSSCLKDFIGHANPEYYASLADFIFEVRTKNQDGRVSFSIDDSIPLYLVLEKTLLTIRLHESYRTSATHKEDSTSGWVKYYFFGKNPIRGLPEWTLFKRKIDNLKQDNDHKIINEIIDYHKNLESDNDFQHNLKVIANEEKVEYKQYGIACYMAQNYFNFEKKKAKWQLENEENAKKKNEYIGEIKKRITFENLIYKGTNSFSNQFGDTYYHSFEDSDGRSIVARGSKPMRELLQQYDDKYIEGSLIEGDIISILGTIKDHKEFRERKQTLINRVKIKGYKKEEL